LILVLPTFMTSRFAGMRPSSEAAKLFVIMQSFARLAECFAPLSL